MGYDRGPAERRGELTMAAHLDRQEQADLAEEVHMALSNPSDWARIADEMQMPEPAGLGASPEQF